MGVEWFGNIQQGYRRFIVWEYQVWSRVEYKFILFGEILVVFVFSVEVGV